MRALLDCFGNATEIFEIVIDIFKRVYVLKGGWRMWLKVTGQVEPRLKV